MPREKTTAAVEPSEDLEHRLPRNVTPSHYRLTFRPDLSKATFKGSGSIELQIHKETHELVCNAVELEISSAILYRNDGTNQTASISFDEERERAIFAFDSPLTLGEATLQLKFQGILNDRLRGFYKSTYEDAEGKTKTIATTQFESTDARRAFPCWDEPDRKAIFEISLEIEEGMQAFSNSPIKDVENVEETTPLSKAYRRINFAPTMKMSTYLVAMIVGELEATKVRTVGGVPVRIVFVPGKGNLTTFALEIAEHALKFFSTYFAIPYPADKLDLVAIPDFAFGAMENLGCVTFRETALLVDPNNAARTELERVADVVAHEIAHMWFGDLVTMRWWEGIWLNEAFATFMEVLCVDAFRPDWQRWVSFGLERESALAVDGLHATRPIEYRVGSPKEADGMFDVLTYQKGGSVLRMLEQYLGAEVFRNGVRNYLNKHAYANTVTNDLWDALEEASGEPCKELMGSWILQGGHPIISVATTLTCISQSPSSYSSIPSTEASKKNGDDTSAIGSLWQVPVHVRDLKGVSKTTKFLVKTTPVSIGLESVKKEDQNLVVNAGGWGVFRVRYGQKAQQMLGDHLSDLDPLERCNLFADTWALVLSGHEKTSTFFSLVQRLGESTNDDPSAWSVALGALSLCDKVVHEKDRAVFESGVAGLLGATAARLGWEPKPNESERVSALRASILSCLGTIGKDQKTLDEAASRFDAMRDKGVSINPDLESAVLGCVATQMRQGDYEEILARYRNPTNPQVELRYLTTLAGFPNSDLALRTYDLAKAEVRTQNAPYLLISLFANRTGGATVWARVMKDWDELLSRFPINSHSRMLDGVRALCRDETIAGEVREFLLAHPLDSGQRSVTQTLERLAINVDFKRREANGFAEIFSPFASSS